MSDTFFLKLIRAIIRQSDGNVLSFLLIRKYRSIRLFLRVLITLSVVRYTSERRYLNRFIRYVSIVSFISSYSFILLAFVDYLLNPRFGFFFIFFFMGVCCSSLVFISGVSKPNAEDSPKFGRLEVCLFSFLSS